MTMFLFLLRVLYSKFVAMSPDSKDPQTGIQLLGIVVANGMPPYDPDTAEMVEEQK